jgi:carboxyl-terminal processing protease
MTARSKLVVALVSTPLVAFVLVGGLLGKSAAGQSTYQHLRVFEDVVQLVLSAYVEEVDIKKAMDGALRGLADGLDPDSAYLTADLARQAELGTPLPEGDVGLALTRQYYVRVLAVRDGSPAARAGLRTHDYIRAIDGRSTRDVSVFEATRLLRGAPGTVVALTVLRGTAADPHVVKLVREKLAGPELTARALAPGVGYVRIAAFSARTREALAQRVDELVKSGARALVIDLRGTADGPLDAGLEAARLFVPTGTLAQLAGRSGQPQLVAARPGDGAVALPVVVLTTNGTAGAAELFAAALAGNGRADLVGERTAGRAGVQRVVRLPDDRALWLTVSRYLTPKGEPIHGQGLAPTVEVDDPEVEFGAPPPAADPILERALERLGAKRAA